MNTIESSQQVQRQRQTLRRLTLAAVVATFCLVVVGNIVRVTESGLGCPDWPLCYGNVVPGLTDTKAVIEVAHRVFAAVVSVLICALAWLNYRWNTSPRLKSLSNTTLILLAVQIILGALTVWTKLHAWIVASHLATGMSVLGCMVAMHLNARALAFAPETDISKAVKGMRIGLAMTTGTVLILLFTGGLLGGSGGATACGIEFPLCHGGLLPNGGPLTMTHWVHRFMVLLTSLLVYSAIRQVFAAHKRGGEVKVLLKPAIALGCGLLLQATVGASIVLLGRPLWMVTLHNAVGAFTWSSAVALSTIAALWPIEVPEREVKALPGWQRQINDYVALTKPRVISLLLFTTIAAMFITPAGAPPWYLVCWTLLGGYLMAGGANAVNMAYDTDIDTKMSRTQLRPTVGGRISAKRALIFGLTLSTLSLLIFVLFVNWLAAAFAAAGFFYYTVIYTHWLKRVTWQNIVIGGGAGAIPPLIGFAAASGQITLSAILLFVIIFYWTPPHFWALALMLKKNYAAAGIPMLPVVAGDAETTKQIMLYTVAMVAFTLLMVPIQAMGMLYLAGALVLGAIFLWRSWQVNRQQTPARVLDLYKYSLLYLALLFAVMMADRLVTPL